MHLWQEGKCFRNLIYHAYLQVELDKESRQYTTVNTHKGLFRYNRLLFGVASAPSIFQRVMENLLKDIDGVSVYVDDVLVTCRESRAGAPGTFGKSDAEIGRSRDATQEGKVPFSPTNSGVLGPCDHC